MSRTHWPPLASIGKCAELFTELGHEIHRSNLSRWISDRRFPGVQAGKRLLYDPNALFDHWVKDYGRRIAAGETGKPAPSPSQAAALFSEPGLTPGDPAGGVRPAVQPASGAAFDRDDDPKRRLANVQAQKAQLELDQSLGKLLAAEDVAAGLADALAEMRSVFARKGRDEAAKLLTELGLPGHMQGVMLAGLKRYAAAAQEAWAEAASELLKASTVAGSDARLRLEALVAFDIELRNGAGRVEPAARQLETTDS